MPRKSKQSWRLPYPSNLELAQSLRSSPLISLTVSIGRYQREPVTLLYQLLVEEPNAVVPYLRYERLVLAPTFIQSVIFASRLARRVSRRMFESSMIPSELQWLNDNMYDRFCEPPVALTLISLVGALPPKRTSAQSVEIPFFTQQFFMAWKSALVLLPGVIISCKLNHCSEFIMSKWLPVIFEMPYWAETEICACWPQRPRLEVRIITPLAARDPQIAVDDASFNTVIDSMSFGFRVWNVPEVISEPSRIYSGVVDALIEVTPRIRIETLADGSPEEVNTCKPETCPWRASPILAIGRCSNLSALTVSTDPAIVPNFLADP